MMSNEWPLAISLPVTGTSTSETKKAAESAAIGLPLQFGSLLLDFGQVLGQYLL